jgi:hypothetical protein
MMYQTTRQLDFATRRRDIFTGTWSLASALDPCAAVVATALERQELPHFGH